MNAHPETARAPGPGRPRLTSPKRAGATASEEILDAAAELFTTGGFTATSTRAIAEAVGIRQATMYHYFATKDEILAELLETTVSGSLTLAHELLTADGPALDRLLRLARYDVTQLARSRWNLGALYLLPELASDRFAPFRTSRDELARVYSALAAEALADPADQRRLLPFRLVESVIMMRSDDQRSGERTATDLIDTIVDAIRTLTSPAA